MKEKNNKILNIFILKKIKLFYFKIFFLLSCFLIYSIFADLTWQLPAKDVSPTTADHNEEKIVTDISGQNVYIVWKSSATVTSVQTVISNDFGNSFSSPVTLSDISGLAQLPQIATNNTGKYVYSVYAFLPSSAGFRILFTRSTDFGQTWTTGASQITLSSSLTNISFIATNNSGQYVYAIWNNANTIVQFSRSIDFGENWLSTGNVINLSDTTSVGESFLSTNDSGQYIYATWTGFKPPDTIRRVQVSSSSDFGVTWTPFANIPNLSANDANASFLDIASSSSGQYAYIVWQKSVGGATVVQFSRTQDFGDNWTASPGINLSSTTAGISSTRPKVATDKTGRYVFVIWDHSGGGTDQSIRIRRSTDFGATFENPIIIPSDNPSIPDIAIDNVGRYVYAVWSARDGAAFIQESSLSFDFGQTFTTPQRISSQAEDSFGDTVITTSESGIYAYSSLTRFSNVTFQLISQVVNGIDLPRTIKRFNLVKPN